MNQPGWVSGAFGGIATQEKLIRFIHVEIVIQGRIPLLAVVGREVNQCPNGYTRDNAADKSSPEINTLSHTR